MPDEPSYGAASAAVGQDAPWMYLPDKPGLQVMCLILFLSITIRSTTVLPVHDQAEPPRCGLLRT